MAEHSNYDLARDMLDRRLQGAKDINIREVLRTNPVANAVYNCAVIVIKEQLDRQGRLTDHLDKRPS